MNTVMHRSENGMATLLTAVILTLLATLGALYLSRSTITEIKTITQSANAEDALRNAENGINNGFNALLRSTKTKLYDFINSPPEPHEPGTRSKNEDRDPQGLWIYRFCSLATHKNKSARQIFQDCGNTGGDINPADMQAILVAQGTTEYDPTAVRYIAVEITANPTGGSSYRPGSLAPLTLAASAGTLAGNATVINNDNNLTIWTGKSLAEITGSFETKTIINGNANSTSSDNTQGQSYNIGPDVVTNDYNLKSLVQGNDKTGLERLALGTTFEEFKMRADFSIDLKNETFGSKLEDIKARIADGTGPVFIAIYDSRPNSAVVIDIKTSLGSTSSPVVIATPGTINFSGSPSITGLIYAGTKVDFKGGGTLTGSVVSDSLEGPPGKGNFTIQHGASAMWEAIESKFNATIAKSIQPGTWRDW